MVSWLRLCGWAMLHGILAALATPETASTSWRKSHVSLSSAERVTLASAALDNSISAISTTPAFRATVFYQMAEFDIATNETTNGDDLQKYLSAATISQGQLAKNESVGHAAIRAYAAYKNPVFLGFANDAWTFARSYTISQDNIASGSLPNKDFSLATTCQGVSMVGGTLSALLAEETSNPMYLNAALDSADFISAHLGGTQNLVQDGISARRNDCARDTTTNSFNTGLLIEGLSAVCSFTKNASTQNILDNVITATIFNEDWQTTDGIIARGGSKLGDKYVVRGLAAAYARNTTAPDIRGYVHDYLGVQFNAVIDLAKSNGSDIYGGAWTGPPSSIFSQSNQTTAISALLAGLALLNDSETASTIAGSNPSSSPVAPMVPKAKSPTRAVIAGAVVGSVLLVAIGVAVLLILRRRVRARPSSFAPAPTISTSATQPSMARSISQAFACSPTLPRQSLSKSVLSPVSPTQRQASDLLAQSPADNRTSTVLASLPVLPTNPQSLSSPADLPTTVLVRLLNERLQHRQWDEEELPPEYARREITENV
ncbi:hypothetical protein DFH09DRAFT_1134430 [Mycena vulgaris]|nr:hypothetical protein DFH09DRAFT_1134430 [Mycena vulgaris]